MDEDDNNDDNLSEVSDALEKQGKIENNPQIISDPNFKNNQNMERITPNFLTKYEKARVIGTRALQISNNSPVLVDLGKEDINPILIAEKELAEKKIPFVIRRHLPDGSYEDWKVGELNIIERF